MLQALTDLYPLVMLNSLLALLNSRDIMRNKLASEDPVSIHLSRLQTEASSVPENTIELRHAHGNFVDMSKEVRVASNGNSDATDPF